MGANFADRLTATMEQKGTCACVGIDPVWSRLPESIRSRYPEAPGDPLAACAGLLEFGRGVIDAVVPMVGVVKINIAFFEPFGGVGFEAYFELIRYARDAGLMTIGDVKRADIGHSSEAYAAAHLARANCPDAITINPYFGSDGVAPFIETARWNDRGVFVLVHTSNTSAGEVQHFGSNDRNVASVVAQRVHEGGAGEGLIGDCGFSAVGAVVAPDDPKRAHSLREIMPKTIFLAPGFGAQGRSAEQVAACFTTEDRGAVVNSSRGVIYAFDADQHRSAGGAWQDAVTAACRQFVTALREAINRHADR